MSLTGIHFLLSYVDACHLCYEARCALRERFPEHLAPLYVYGAESSTSGRRP